MAELLDCLCLENPTIMGVSFGGVLAMEFATRYPYRLKDLIIQGAGSRFEHYERMDRALRETSRRSSMSTCGCGAARCPTRDTSSST